MMNLLKSLVEKPIEVVALLLGIVVVALSVIDVKSWRPHDDIAYPALIVGTIIVAVALVAALAKARWSDLAAAAIATTDDGFAIDQEGTQLRVVLGRIEEVQCTNTDCLVALPANEYFDDDCASDKSSALGAFLDRHFPGSIDKVQSQARAQLGEPTEQVERRTGEFATSYGVGRCVFLERPMGSLLNLAMASVTTMRAGEGLRADPAGVMRCVDAIAQAASENRKRHIIVPLLGCGHGGLKPELSLVSMLIAFGTTTRRRSNLKRIDVVVFRPDSERNPTIAESRIRQALAFIRTLG